MNPNLRNFALWAIIILLVLALVTLFQIRVSARAPQEIPLSQLLVEGGSGPYPRRADQGPGSPRHHLGDSPNFQTYAPSDPSLVRELTRRACDHSGSQSTTTPWFVSILLVSRLPFIALIGAWFFLSRQMQNGAGRAMGFGKSKAKLLNEAHGRVTFEDVAGVDEAKEDLQGDRRISRDPGKIPETRR